MFLVLGFDHEIHVICTWGQCRNAWTMLSPLPWSDGGRCGFGVMHLLHDSLSGLGLTDHWIEVYDILGALTYLLLIKHNVVVVLVEYKRNVELLADWE